MKAQARALIDAAGGRALNIMFPMVSEPWEFDEARALFEAQRGWIASRNRMLPSQIRYGAILEVPALAEQLDLLLPKRSEEHTSELQALMRIRHAVVCMEKTKV